MSSLLAQRAYDKGVELLFDSAPEVPQALRGDPLRLGQILTNLVSNSVKFTAAGGSVEVRASTEGPDAVIVVEDTGRGISPEFLPYVFDRFRQEEQSLSREHDGLGLGLAIVKHLVELHGGRTTAESEGVGRGTRVTVRIPTDGRAANRKGAPDPDVMRAPVEGSRAGGVVLPRLDGTTVLFVDDQPEARELVSIVLGQCGARVITVETAERAMRALGVCVPDILISDVGLPDEDGYTLIRKIRALGPAAGGNVPAIALTAFARPEDQRRARDEGFQVHMAKPVEPDELVSLVASLVRGPATTPSRTGDPRVSSRAS
ncbi:MAG: response regulator [Myxococcales bacterium]|nr:response regulator [Myxococcales bacterium]